jgi:hypothetical protein
VTGASGSGKTTLLNAIATALRQPAIQPVPGVATAVLADDYLFTGTVASNLRLANPAANDDDISDLLASMLLDRTGLTRAPRSASAGTASPAVSSAASTSPVPSPPDPMCCSSTNRPRASTPAPAPTYSWQYAVDYRTRYWCWQCTSCQQTPTP